jgi:predicted ATPase
MLEMLHLKNVGPAPEMKLEFGSRLNVITGDNGLGKSFILDCTWFGLTETWGQEINSALTASGMARAIDKALIDIKIRFDKKEFSRTFEYSLEGQNWYRVYPTPAEEVLRRYRNLYDSLGKGILIHSHFDGGFSVYDSVRHRSFWKTEDKLNANVFTENEVWHVTQSSEGVIRDVANWQRENGQTFQQFKAVLECLSPNSKDKLELGELVPVRLEDGFDTPTIKMPYGDSTPITQASSGIRKIISFAYMLVWAWRQHQRASQVLKREPEKRLTFLIDEIESHLHPRWQRTIVQSLLNVTKALSDELEVQIILTTHSPLVMASLEPFFDSKKDAWFDLNLVDGEVTLEKMNFVKRGGAEMWLLSDAFDLQTTGSPQREKAIARAARAIENPKLTKKNFLIHDKELRDLLSETDEYWLNWRFYGERKGWL